MKTWEVKLDTTGNGLITVNVDADGWESTNTGASFFETPLDSGERECVAFFPLARLVSIKEVTP